MTIVAAIDESDAAIRVVEEADKLASAFNDELQVVHVINQSKYENLVQDSAKQWDALERGDVQEIAENVAQKVTRDIGDHEVVALIGDEAASIVTYADECDARYVVMGGRRRSPLGKVMFGSVTQSVLLNIDRPVVSVMGA
jgi:nucleotide-binding universal stress UspA family protein